MFTEKENLILWYLNYTDIDITDKKVYELSSKYDPYKHTHDPDLYVNVCLHETEDKGPKQN